VRGPEIRQTHPYQPAPGSWPTKAPCADPCGMPWNARIHAVQETPPEVAEIRDRMLGETNE
jgi:hypothetical protein